MIDWIFSDLGHRNDSTVEPSLTILLQGTNTIFVAVEPIRPPVKVCEGEHIHICSRQNIWQMHLDEIDDILIRFKILFIYFLTLQISGIFKSMFTFGADDIDRWGLSKGWVSNVKQNLN